MRFEEYTPDATCRTLGLPGFIESHWAQLESPTLRVVLTPAFHPELCLTFSRSGGSASLSVVARAERYWAQRSLGYLPRNHEEAHLPPEAFEEAVALFRVAHAAVKPEGRYVWIDGMGLESCLVSGAGTQQLHEHASERTDTGKFISRVIDLAWNSCRDPRVRNALGHAAHYVSVEYPMQDVPPAPQITRLAVLGTPQERNEYLEMLRRHKEAKG